MALLLEKASKKINMNKLEKIARESLTNGVGHLIVGTGFTAVGAYLGYKTGLDYATTIGGVIGLGLFGHLIEEGKPTNSNYPDNDCSTEPL